MKTFWRISLATVLAIVTLLSSTQVEPRAVAQTVCSYDFSAVAALIRDAVRSVPLDGASLMLIKDGQVIYEGYFGGYNADTTVRIASASKWLSGATLMTLVDEGKLSLSDPVSKYLPYFTDVKGTMTIRQMFSHTSGLPGMAGDGGGDAGCIYNKSESLDNCARQIAQLDLIGPPGAQFAYGQNSMQVAGRICEIVSGQSWESLFQERIAIPLEMTDATFGPSANPIIAGGARLKLNDYANFLRMILNEGQLNGRRVLSVESVREMQRDLTAGLPVVWTPIGESAVNYAIGEWIDILDAQGNAVQVSSPGAFGFTPWVDKKRNLLGVFLVQNQRQNVASTIDMIQQNVREAVDACARPVASVSAASYDGGALAPESIAVAFGSNLATRTASADTTPLPSSLAGTILRVQDAAGDERMAPLFYASPTQINFQIPPGTANGSATITVTNGDGALSIGPVQISPVAPGIFSADASGRGLAAATVLRIKADGSEVYEPVARFDPAANKFVAAPIDVSAAGEQVYLILFGTGIRYRSALSAVSVKFGGVDGQVLFAGAQTGFIGLDQLNILLPTTLAGRGEVDVVLTADGKVANTVRITIR